MKRAFLYREWKATKLFNLKFRFVAQPAISSLLLYMFKNYVFRKRKRDFAVKQKNQKIESKFIQLSKFFFFFITY